MFEPDEENIPDSRFAALSLPPAPREVEENVTREEFGDPGGGDELGKFSVGKLNPLPLSRFLDEFELLLLLKTLPKNFLAPVAGPEEAGAGDAVGVGPAVGVAMGSRDACRRCPDAAPLDELIFFMNDGELGTEVSARPSNEAAIEKALAFNSWPPDERLVTRRRRPSASTPAAAAGFPADHAAAIFEEGEFLLLQTSMGSQVPTRIISNPLRWNLATLASVPASVTVFVSTLCADRLYRGTIRRWMPELPVEVLATEDAKDVTLADAPRAVAVVP